MKTKLAAQQGDVLFFREEALPEGAKRVNPEDGRTIFARGEATGHHHSCPAVEGELYEDEEGARWFQAAMGATVTHQEHGAVTLEPGVYRIGIVREYDHLEEEARRVAD